MAVKLPDYTSLGGADVRVSGGPVPRYSPEGFNTDAIGKGFQAAAKAVEAFQADYEKLEDFETQRKFYETMSAADQQFQQDSQNADPTGRDFAKTAAQNYGSHFDSFLSNVPQRLRPQYEATIARQRMSYGHKATDFEFRQRESHYTAEVLKRADALKDGVLANPDSYDSAIADVTGFLDKSGLSPTARHKVLGTIEDTFAANRITGLRRIPGREQEANDFEIQLDERERQRQQSLPGRGARLAPTDAQAITESAGRLGIAPRDLAAVISYETGGTFSTSKFGGKGGNYMGLIQFGPSERAKYGARPDQSIPEQMQAVEAYLVDRGLKPGMGLAEIYTIINAGSLKNGQVRWNASDGNGTIRDHVARIEAQHYGNADRAIGGGGQRFAQADTGTATDASSSSNARGGPRADINDLNTDLPVGRWQAYGQRAQFEVDKAIKLRQAEDARANAEMEKAEAARLDRVLVDASSGRGALPPRAMIEDNPDLKEEKRNELLRKYDAVVSTADTRGKLERKQTIESHQKAEAAFLDRALVDAAAGGALPSREEIENNRFITEEKRNELLRKRDSLARERENAAQAAIKEEQKEGEKANAEAEKVEAARIERLMIDASAGVGQMPTRADIADNPMLREEKRNDLLRKYDVANKEAIALQRAVMKFTNADAGTYNPFDPDEKKAVDRIYGALGGNLDALETVVRRTGMVPTTAVRDLRGALVSNDPQRVGAAMSVALNLIDRNPNIFAGKEGANDIEDAAVAYRQYVERFGMTAEQATAKIIEGQSAEYKASVKARIKGEDINELVKKNLKIDDIGSAFDPSSLPFTTPKVEFTGKARAAVFSDYAELFKLKYEETGDVSLAKEQAAAQLKKVWGVTGIAGGNGVVMRFPPERAPAYANIPNVSDRIAEQAVADIKEATGQDVQRKNLILMPTAGGHTSRAYTTGQPVPYTLSWFDKDGRLQTLNPGKAFMPDPKRMREALSVERQKKFETGAAVSDVNRELGDPRMPFGVPGPGAAMPRTTVPPTVREQAAPYAGDDDPMGGGGVTLPGAP